VIACPGIGSGQAADALVSIVSQSGDYHAVRVASDRVQFARTFRPTWATVLGWCTIIFAFIGVLFFFVKTTETCIAVIEADHRGTRIRLSGRLDAEVLQRLLATFDDPAGAARDAAQAAAVGAPVDSASPTSSFSSVPSFAGPPPQTGRVSSVPHVIPSPAMAAPSGPPANLAPPQGAPVATEPPSGTPVHMSPPQGAPYADPPVETWPPAAQQAPVPSQTPPPFNAPFPGAATGAGAPSVEPVFPQAPAPSSGGWVPVWERDDQPGSSDPVVPDPAFAGSALGFDPSSTIIVRKQSQPGGSTLRAVLDDGTDLDLSKPVLLGRDPSAGPDEAGTTLIPVADPERSVSKTHLKVVLLGGVVLATDRGSTNGSALVLADGTENALEPGVPTEVPSGCVVRFGTRTVRVLSVGAIGGPL